MYKVRSSVLIGILFSVLVSGCIGDDTSPKSNNKNSTTLPAQVIYEIESPESILSRQLSTDVNGCTSAVKKSVTLLLAKNELYKIDEFTVIPDNGKVYKIANRNELGGITVTNSTLGMGGICTKGAMSTGDDPSNIHCILDANCVKVENSTMKGYLHRIFRVGYKITKSSDILNGLANETPVELYSITTGKLNTTPIYVIDTTLVGCAIEQGFYDTEAVCYARNKKS